MQQYFEKIKPGRYFVQFEEQFHTAVNFKAISNRKLMIICHTKMMSEPAVQIILSQGYHKNACRHLLDISMPVFSYFLVLRSIFKKWKSSMTCLCNAGSFFKAMELFLRFSWQTFEGFLLLAFFKNKLHLKGHFLKNK